MAWYTLCIMGIGALGLFVVGCLMIVVMLVGWLIED